jgi:bifunctional non-homologous end joining protein LigD
VPKGPSLDPADKRLAMLTENHPLEYVEFEDVIPEGNYGAGSMIAWDVGRIRYLETTAEEGMQKGKLDFTLHGFKLRGRFALVETGHRQGKGSREDGKQWLLIKKQDAFATKSDVLVEQPESVLGGLLVEELARREEIAAELVQQAADAGAPVGPLAVDRFTPMLCTTEGGKLDDPTRLYELKLDGVRIVADKHGRSVALRYRNGRPATATYPEIVRAVAALAPERLVLDGEVVAFDAEGRPSFAAIAPRIHAAKPLDVLRAQAEVPVTYLAFDLLALGDRDLTSLPLHQRKRLLASVVRGRGMVRALDHLDGSGEALFAFCREQRLEGVVAKKRDSSYRPGPVRSEDWIKIKCERDDEFVVIGWLEGKGVRTRLGALCVASHGPDGQLRYRGRVGSGLDDDAIDRLLPRLKALETKGFPLAGPVPPEAKAARWVRPEIVICVRFLAFTPDAHLRAPVFRGERPEVSVAACRAMPPEELLEVAASALPDEASVETADAAPDANAPVAKTKAEPQHARAKVTNRDKIFWPDEGYTKGDLIEYYAAVAPAMLPFLEERPVVMVRYPDGIRGKSFFQWNVPPSTPDWLRRAVLYDSETREDKQDKVVFLVDDVDALVYLANLGTIPLHVLACRERTRDECDFLTIDFDIGDHPFERAVVLALTFREILDEIGLSGFPKTSGQKGLHVLVPLGPGVNFDAAKLLCELFGELIVARHPQLCTLERRVDKRQGKALIDIGQTGPSRTIVAPYSVRAWPGATVSTPLYWEEVHVALDPKRFTLLTVPTRLAESGDPLAGLLDQRPNLGEAVAALEALQRERAASAKR